MQAVRRRVRGCRCNASERAQDTAAVEAPEKVTTAEDVVWDPKGLLANAGPKQPGLLERKLALRRAAQAQAGVSAAGPPIQRVSSEALSRGGLAKGEQEDGFSWDSFAAQLEANYCKVNLDFPGLRVLNIEPPIMSIDSFMDDDTCEAFMQAASASGLLKESTIGNGALFSAENTYSARRTSSSMLVDKACLQDHADLKALAERMQATARQLLAHGPWSATARMPPPGGVCFEALQIARYEAGQHFLAHEDGFPVEMAQDNTFQRAATVLLYLNTVPSGGRTKFEHLGLEVAPKQGRVLLFFPSFADGRPDARTLHSAEDAVDMKWVAQQWVARGLQVEGEGAEPPSSRPAAPRGAGLPRKAAALLGARPVVPRKAATKEASSLASRLSGVIADLSPLAAEDESPLESVRRARKSGKKGKGKGTPGKSPGKGFGS